jgi:hypothetical protein
MRNVAKFKAVIWFKGEVHKVLESGECSGEPVHKVDKILAIDAEDKAICINKLIGALETLKNACGSQ